MNPEDVGHGQGGAIPRSPADARKRLDTLLGERKAHLGQRESTLKRLESVEVTLEVAPEVEVALEQFTGRLFGNVVAVIERQLSLALQETLQQDLQLKAEPEVKNGRLTLAFHVERGDGRREDILKGQGGSVANVLSVGLRLFALATLDEKEHRRFLVLDEQDCWLHPDLVPRLVKIVHGVCQVLGFQVLMISHHDRAAFERYADRIYELTPAVGGVSVRQIGAEPVVSDGAEPHDGAG
jgi:DNA repair exonuclease SbcCD ATPase subunit